ncbi:glycosyltransferase [Amphibiibacter pelophylacis]|uniref:Glycosyltransferase n=1 Tax=Amphibiibacter pelophylacis TaxID=1799477 RepID=A0ACC6P1S0_9BURK
MSVSNHSLSFSIVSHGQAALIAPLLGDLARLPPNTFEVILTINLPEDESPYFGYTFPIRIIRNSEPKGFGANHNAAFTEAKGNYFAVVNPDIRIQYLDLHELLMPFQNENIAAVAPIVLSSEGKIEDSARHFPTLQRFAKRVILRKRVSDYKLQKVPFAVDWVAGMFVVFRTEAYRKINGFDDHRFFMYLEDADICRRLHKNGWGVLVNPFVSVTHMAQRASRRNLTHMRWHAVSALRYLTGL